MDELSSRCPPQRTQYFATNVWDHPTIYILEKVFWNKLTKWLNLFRDMIRQLRIKYEGAFYQITSQGNQCVGSTQAFEKLWIWQNSCESWHCERQSLEAISFFCNALEIASSLHSSQWQSESFFFNNLYIIHLMGFGVGPSYAFEIKAEWPFLALNYTLRWPVWRVKSLF